MIIFVSPSRQLAEARIMRYFSNVVGGINFCRVSAFSSVL